MGLDQYLNKRINCGAEFIEEIAYWRKANHIHRWFVENVQGGKDDCDIYYLSEEKLKQLLDKCKKVKENKNAASETLPTQDGFFFGGTDYDEDYYESIDYTIKVIEDLLAKNVDNKNIDADIYYRSSW